MHKYDIELDENKRDSLNIIFNQISFNSKVLEFGCANGRLTKRLVNEKNCKVTIIEKDRELYNKAINYAEDGMCTDIMEFEWTKYKETPFDYIIFADVLEHLNDPKKVLNECKNLLKKSGKLLISIPNLAHNDILIQLYKNALDYSETGIMDKTHVYFFSYNGAMRLFQETGYDVILEDCISVMTGCTEQLLSKKIVVNDFVRSLEQRTDGNIYQYVFQLALPGSENKKVSLLEHNCNFLERRIFFDFGNGYSEEQQIIYYARKSDKFFSVKTQIPDGTKIVRFDPVMKMPCQLSKLQVISNRGELQITSELLENNTIILGTFEPSIFITDLEQVDWLEISGEIEYSYDYYQKSRIVESKEKYEEIINHIEKELRLEKEKCQKLESINGVLNECKDMCSKLEEELKNSKEQEKILKNELINERENSSLYDRKLEKIRKLLEESICEKNNLEAEKCKYEEENKKMHMELEDKKKEQENYINKINSCCKETQYLKEEIKTYTEQFTELNTVIKRLQDQLEERQKMVETYSEKANSYVTKLQCAQTQITDLQKYQRVTEEKIRQYEKQTSSLTLESTNAKLTIQDLENEKRRSEEVSLQRDANIQHLQRVLKEKEQLVRAERMKNQNLNDLIEVYKGSTSWKVTAPLRAVTYYLRKVMESGNHQSTLLLEEKNNERMERTDIIANQSGDDADIWRWDICKTDFHPLVTVIVPNYNHEAYLEERLESIYRQTYDRFEVILLDDCSTDGSRTILEKYAKRYPEKTRCVFNSENCGKIVWQWNKGIQMAKGEVIWIAESDDYCELNYLEKMVPLLARESVMLAFARSVFMQDGQQIWSTEEYLSDIQGMDWSRPFTMSATKIVEKAFSIKNIIPNVSSAIFRNIGQVENELQSLFGQMKLSGDWIFYLNLIKGGCISYTNETTNYYRVHKTSTSLKVQHTMNYYSEYEAVCEYIARYYKVPDENYEIIRHILKEHYRAIHKTENADIIDNYFVIEKIKETAANRIEHVLMACFSLQPGGGETYSIYLANELKRQGLVVTMLDFGMEKRDIGIRGLLRKDIPLVSLDTLDYFYQVISQLGGDIIHSHHASVDMSIASWLKNGNIDIKHIITLHGMYDTMDDAICKNTLQIVDPVCKKYIYIADKNLEPFKKQGCYCPEHFVKLPNGLPVVKPGKLSRSEYGYKESDFICVLASRGIPEKGWKEAMDAVELANKKSKRKICLLVLGDGVMRKQLEERKSEYVKFLGVRENVRDFYAMGDVGLVPTRFKGESYPLVIIECLQCGKPVIATDIAEVKNQLTDENGNLAGALLSLKDWKLDVEEIAKIITSLANDSKYYTKVKKRCNSAAKKFNIENVARMYRKIYEEVLAGDKEN